MNSIFEVFAVYFSNCYWNNLYKAALTVWENEEIDTLDEAYVTTINRYNTAFCKLPNKNEPRNKHYNDIVRDIHSYYKNYLQSYETYLGFIQVVVSHIIPKNYNIGDRYNDVFRDVMSQTLTQFTMFICKDEVRYVVDKNFRKDINQSKVRVTQWKQKFLDILISQKNMFCSLIMAKDTGVNIKNRDEIPSIPKEICDKLQEKIKQLILEKNEAIKRANNFAKLATEYKNIIINLQNTKPVIPPPKPVIPSPVPSPVPSPAPVIPEPEPDIFSDSIDELIPDLDLPDDQYLVSDD
jgi:hypothetical protein